METGKEVSCHGNQMGVAEIPEVLESTRKSFSLTVVPLARACNRPLIPALGKL